MQTLKYKIEKCNARLKFTIQCVAWITMEQVNNYTKKPKTTLQITQIWRCGVWSEIYTRLSTWRKNYDKDNENQGHTYII